MFKKTGQFVTFWKRGSQGQTIPFTIDDEPPIQTSGKN
ncbi:MepB family protein [Sphingobacterium sp. HMA12]